MRWILIFKKAFLSHIRPMSPMIPINIKHQTQRKDTNKFLNRQIKIPKSIFLRGDF